MALDATAPFRSNLFRFSQVLPSDPARIVAPFVFLLEGLETHEEFIL